MHTEVTTQQIEQYRREGWIIVEDFLGVEELEEMNAAIDESVAQMGSTKLAGNGNKDIADSPDSYYGGVFFQRVNMWKIHPVIGRYFLDAELGHMLCRLAGIDGIRIWHDQTLQKMPWASPTSWHIDVPNWSFHSPDAVSIWIALEDATIQNGCMYYLPGSHKVADYQRKGGFGPNMGGLFDDYPELRQTRAMPVELKAGSAGIHNGLMAHAAGPNMTPGSRRAMTCAYMPDGATFNGIQNILSDEQVAALKVGDALDDESQNPLLWSAGG
ncbi:MAG: phytanoyl-CoA dioxygenase family protein [Candidatus Latescibacteria bacterium]|nr:phytanoyl-CoA dioxygenase family protein [Candidatus Latescibacterota bacterium]